MEVRAPPVLIKPRVEVATYSQFPFASERRSLFAFGVVEVPVPPELTERAVLNVGETENVVVPVTAKAPEIVPPETGKYVLDKSGISEAVRPEILLRVASEIVRGPLALPERLSMAFERAMLLV